MACVACVASYAMLRTRRGERERKGESRRGVATDASVSASESLLATSPASAVPRTSACAPPSTTMCRVAVAMRKLAARALGCGCVVFAFVSHSLARVGESKKA